ncbi:hypothetical protein A0H76_1609 [Hepatospora eriocheir]|uniref:Uncharacterized protein n=1 Tax=Hepatospora eriocheir TaxID=1081669 RepID=A0A1X0QKT2_9MICR|nr:hypothetical protein A0H76_1609 [Hepatospora eriocheir]
MSLSLNDLNKIILKFENNDRLHLVKYAFKKSIEKINEDNDLFHNKKLILTLNLCQYLKDKYKAEFIDFILDTKILNMRALILDFVDTDYKGYQKYFYKPERWMRKLIKDIKETFMLAIENSELKFTDKINDYKYLNIEKIEKTVNFEDSDTLDEIFNEYGEFNKVYQQEDLKLSLIIFNNKLVREFEKIFLGTEEFGRAGNQLVLNFICYSEYMKLTNKDFQEFISKIYQNINQSNRIDLNELNEAYKEYKSN